MASANNTKQPIKLPEHICKFWLVWPSDFSPRVTQTEMAQLPRDEVFPPSSAQQWHPVVKCFH